MEQEESQALDKTIFRVASVHEPSDEREYWLRQAPQDRLRAVEQIRRIVYGEQQSTARLQRVFEITQLTKG